MPAEGLTKCCGTRGYWAPEMIARPKIPYFISSDWFSLGVCLYELLTGTNPFFLIAEQQLQHSPEYDRSQFEAAVDRAILEVEPDLSAVVPAGEWLIFVFNAGELEKKRVSIRIIIIILIVSDVITVVVCANKIQLVYAYIYLVHTLYEQLFLAGDDPVGGERKRSVLGPPSRASSENSNRKSCPTQRIQYVCYLSVHPPVQVQVRLPVGLPYLQL